jgi:putative DNA primase/helicase
MVRRTLLCNLDPQAERPELIQYGFDPFTRALDNRGAYVAAVITIARAYGAAGAPAVCPNLNGYGPWSDRVRAPLIWLGEADPVESMEQARAEDPVLASMQELFENWHEHLGTSVVTARQVIDVAVEQADRGAFLRPEFRDLLVREAGAGGFIDAKRLGRWLTRIHGRPVGGRTLRMHPDAKRGNSFALLPAARA